MPKIVAALFACFLAGPAHAATMYRVDLDIDAQGEAPDHALMIVEGGKVGTMELGDPAGVSRRYEVRVDATEDTRGVTTGNVFLRVLRVKRGRERELGEATVPIARVGVPVDWQPRRKAGDIAIRVTLYRQPF